MKTSSRPSTSWVEVTPEAAQRWLSEQAPGSNRGLRKSAVSSLAQQIRAGTFHTCYQPIIFNGKRLLDGQHRLAAVVEAGKSIHALVLREVPTEAMSVLDTGISRRPADIFSLHQVVSASTAAALSAWLIRLIDGVSRQRKIPSNEMLKFYTKHSDEVAWGITLPTAASPKKRNARFMAPFIFARRADPEKVEKAAQMFFSDEGLTKGSPLHALHVYANSTRFVVESRGGSSLPCLMTLVALRAFLDERQLFRVMTQSGVAAEEAREFFAGFW